MDNQEIQGTLGALKAPTEGEGQPPIEEDVGRFRTTSATYDDLDPREVQPFAVIPDYIDPTLSPYPLVVESDGVFHCVDGWEMIQKAIGEAKDRITCDVSHVSGYSETEIAIRKTAARTMPKGGVARYPEIIRNTRIIKDKIISSMENPVIYSHGGARKGEDFTKNREDDVRVLLAERLGKSRKTINFHLSFAEHLTDEALGELAEGGAEKEFFEKAQVVKRRIIDNLIDSDTPKEEITAQVSEAMLQMYRDPQEIENRKMALFQGAKEDSTTEEDSPFQEAPPTTLNTEAEKETPQFKHWAGAEEDSSQAISTEEEVRRQGVEIAGRMMARFQDKELTLTALKEGVTQDLGELATLVALIKESE